MSKPEQLLFDLSLKQAYEKEDFWISDSNRDAIAWLEQWPNWPNTALVIIGPSASGKTHLIKIWGKSSKALEVNSDTNIETIPDMLASQADIKHVSIDGLDALLGNEAKEKALFHLYNTIKERGGTILISARKAIKEHDFKVPDLKTRLLAASAVAISSPDETLIAILLGKIFSDKQLVVPQEVISYIVPRVERSFNAVKTLADEIDRKAFAEKKPVTVPLVRSIIEFQGNLLH